MDQAEIAIPIMQATVQGQSALADFCSIRVGFGKVDNSGTDSDPRITFDADPLGFSGSLPLVVLFSLPSWMLQIEDPEDMIIALSFCVSPHTLCFVQKFGMFL